MYNDVLNIKVAREATVMGYAGDVAKIVIGNYLADVELYSSEAL